MTQYWRDHPPLQTMVQAYLGFKPKEEVRLPSQEETTAFLELMAKKAKF